MISVKAMREVEKRARKGGIDDSILMENAGANAAKIADKMFGLKGKDVLVFCGTGNNTGDGLVFARHALMLGAGVKVYFVKGEGSLKPLARRNYAALKGLGTKAGGIVLCRRMSRSVHADMLVDAMLGIGISGDVRPEYEKAIRIFNSMRGIKVSMDCPSGIDADTGRIMGAAVKPDVTITFHDRKPGLDERICGRIVVAGIGIPKA